MRYNTRLRVLENKGINYHRIVADFILQYLYANYQPNTASILVYGDKDLLISYLLSQKFLIHVNNIGFEEPRNTNKIKIVELDSFPLFEYDLIIGLFCDKEFIQNCISGETNFLIIPQYCIDCDSNQFAHDCLTKKNILFNEIEFNAYMPNTTAFYNFDIRKY